MQHFTQRDGDIDPEPFLAALQRRTRKFQYDLVRVVQSTVPVQPSKAS